MSKKIIITLIVAVLLIFSAVAARVDHGRLVRGERPLFALSTAEFKDGGTEVFIGLGYQLISWHRLAKNEQDQSGYLVGTELAYFPLFKYWPFITRDCKPDIELNFTAQR